MVSSFSVCVYCCNSLLDNKKNYYEKKKKITKMTEIEKGKRDSFGKMGCRPTNKTNA